MAVKLAMVMKLAVLALLLTAVSATARSVDLFDLLASNNPEAFQVGKHKETFAYISVFKYYFYLV